MQDDKCVLGIVASRGEVDEMEFLLKEGANILGSANLPKGIPQSGSLQNDLVAIVFAGMQSNHCAQGKFNEAMKFIQCWFD